MENSKGIIISVLISILLIGGVFMIGKNNSSVESDIKSDAQNNVSIVDGKQIIEIRAKGGYTPRKSIAKAGIPTILRFDGKGSFDCSSSVRIPSLNISQNLSQTGVTDIDLGIPKVTVLQGMCGMGMYPFEINFQN